MSRAMVYDMGYPDDEWTESEGGPDEAGGSGRGERAFMNALGHRKVWDTALPAVDKQMQYLPRSFVPRQSPSSSFFKSPLPQIETASAPSGPVPTQTVPAPTKSAPQYSIRPSAEGFDRNRTIKQSFSLDNSPLTLAHNDKAKSHGSGRQRVGVSPVLPQEKGRLKLVKTQSTGLVEAMRAYATSHPANANAPRLTVAEHTPTGLDEESKPHELKGYIVEDSETPANLHRASYQGESASHGQISPHVIQSKKNTPAAFGSRHSQPPSLSKHDQPQSHDTGHARGARLEVEVTSNRSLPTASSAMDDIETLRTLVRSQQEVIALQSKQIAEMIRGSGKEQ